MQRILLIDRDARTIVNWLIADLRAHRTEEAAAASGAPWLGYIDQQDVAVAMMALQNELPPIPLQVMGTYS